MTLALAEHLCGAALAEAATLGFAAAAAVVDAGGHLVAFRRSDDAGFVTAVVAPRKAWTAASSGISTAQWNALATDSAVAPILHSTGLLAVAGGLPVLARSRMIGALGVSGGSAEQDRVAAERALATVAERAA